MKAGHTPVWLNSHSEPTRIFFFLVAMFGKPDAGRRACLAWRPRKDSTREVEEEREKRGKRGQEEMEFEVLIDHRAGIDEAI